MALTKADIQALLKEQDERQEKRMRSVIREETRAEVASQLESRLPVHLAPMQEDIRTIREAYIDDVTVIAAEQITIKRVLSRHSRRLATLETKR